MTHPGQQHLDTLVFSDACHGGADWYTPSGTAQVEAGAGVGN